MVPAQKEVVVINQTKPQVVQEPVSVPPPPAVLARPKSTTPPVPKRKLVKANSKPKSNNFGKATSSVKNFFSDQWKGMLLGAGATFVLMLMVSNKEELFSNMPSFGSLFESSIEREMRNELKKNGKNIRDNMDRGMKEGIENQRKLYENLNEDLKESRQEQKKWSERFDRSFR
jgi:hypothetical protein